MGPDGTGGVITDQKGFEPMLCSTHKYNWSKCWPKVYGTAGLTCVLRDKMSTAGFYPVGN